MGDGKTCPICQKTFTRRNYMLKHIENIHAKRYTCPKCFRYFSGPTEHSCVVENGRATCYVQNCALKFSNGMAMRLHIRDYHQKLDEDQSGDVLKTKKGIRDLVQTLCKKINLLNNCFDELKYQVDTIADFLRESPLGFQPDYKTWNSMTNQRPAQEENKTDIQHHQRPPQLKNTKDIQHNQRPSQEVNITDIEDDQNYEIKAETMQRLEEVENMDDSSIEDMETEEFISAETGAIVNFLEHENQNSPKTAKSPKAKPNYIISNQLLCPQTVTTVPKQVTAGFALQGNRLVRIQTASKVVAPTVIAQSSPRIVRLHPTSKLDTIITHYPKPSVGPLQKQINPTLDAKLENAVPIKIEPSPEFSANIVQQHAVEKTTTTDCSTPPLFLKIQYEPQTAIYESDPKLTFHFDTKPPDH